MIILLGIFQTGIVLKVIALAKAHLLWREGDGGVSPTYRPHPHPSIHKDY